MDSNAREAARYYGVANPEWQPFDLEHLAVETHVYLPQAELARQLALDASARLPDPLPEQRRAADNNRRLQQEEHLWQDEAFDEDDVADGVVQIVLPA